MLEKVARLRPLIEQEKQTQKALTSFVNSSLQLAWKMVTIHPPMIVATPESFDASIHAPQFLNRETKNDDVEALNSSDYEIEYIRPCLFNTFKETDVVKPGHVVITKSPSRTTV